MGGRVSFGAAIENRMPQENALPSHQRSGYRVALYSLT